MLTRREVTSLLIGSFATGRAHAASLADFYRGKTVQIIVGYGPGGGYDIYARVLAQFIGAHIPGEPSIVVQSMPGAGSLRAVNYLYNTAPRDGLVFGIFSRDMPLMAAIGGNPAVQFNPRRFSWLGSSTSFVNDAYVLVAREDAAVKTIGDLQRNGDVSIVLGGTGEGATGNDIPLLLRDVLGFNIRLVTGYPDSGALFVAMERGEIDGRFTDLSSIKAARPQWLKKNSGFHILTQFARATRHPDLPYAPTVRELASNQRGRALIELAEISYALARPFAAPPDIPPERVEALRGAFAAAHRDPDFLRQAEKLGIDISPIGPDEVMRLIERIQAAPRDQLDYLKKLQANAKD
jgi:tripartite-type tricarboxylate transporter receptor subunit TctC